MILNEPYRTTARSTPYTTVSVHQTLPQDRKIISIGVGPWQVIAGQSDKLAPANGNCTTSAIGKCTTHKAV